MAFCLLRSLKVIRTDMDRSATYDFLLNLGIFRTVSEINCYFSRKSQIVRTPCVFYAHDEGLPLGIGYPRSGLKTRIIGLSGRGRSLTISSAVSIQYINVTDGQTDTETDGQTPGDSKDRAYAQRRAVKHSVHQNLKESGRMP